MPRRSGARLFAIAAILSIASWAAPAAQDTPVSITVRAFFKPDGNRLRLLIRVPLEAIRDVTYPTRADGSVDLARVDPSLHQAAQQILDSIDVYEAGIPVARPAIETARLSWLGDPSFGSYEDALAQVAGQRLPEQASVYWNQALLDVLAEYDLRLNGASLAVVPRLAHFGTTVTTVLRVLPSDGVPRGFDYTGDPGVVTLDPRRTETAARFGWLGFTQALRRGDLFLVLFAILLPFRRVRPAFVVLVSFGLAHAATLLGSVYGFATDALWFQPLIQTLSAAAIVYFTLENIVGANVERRMLLAGAIGLVYGFGSAGALQPSLQFAGAHVLVAALSFTAGVELGQFVMFAGVLSVLYVLFRYAVAERPGTIVLSAIALHSAWHWLLERTTQLRRFSWPTFDAVTLVGITRVLMVVVLLAGLGWLAVTLRRAKQGLRIRD